MYFTASKKVKKETIELMDLKQRKGETVKEFSERFHKQVAEIDDVDEKILIKTFRNGLAHPRFAERITTKAPKTHGELAKMIHDFLKSEIAENKAKELVNSFKVTGDKKGGQGGSNPSGSSAGGGSRYKPYYKASVGSSSSKGSQYQNARIAVQIDPGRYAAAVKEGYLPPPKKPQQGEIPVAFCEFHGNSSHRTANCATLAKELRMIEESKKKGKQSVGQQKQDNNQYSRV